LPWLRVSQCGRSARPVMTLSPDSPFTWQRPWASLSLLFQVSCCIESWLWRQARCGYYECRQVCGPRWLSRYSDSLRAGLFSDRIQVGARFSAPAQTCPGAHPASDTMGILPL
jgi:hypothetical protein